jgi:flavin-dependent dehydrogenase
MSPTVAVIGGGPAGATCAWRLARAGVRTLLYERDVTREKPCGGGLTGRAFAALPELAALDLPGTDIETWLLLGPGRGRATLTLTEPFRVVARREFDGALRREAVKAGAALVAEPVRELSRIVGGGWQVNDHAADFVVGAGGMKCPLAKVLDLVLPPEETAVAHGRMAPGEFPPQIVTAFFPAERAYVWWFPRPDHVSFGAVMPGGSFDKQKAQEFLERVARKVGFPEAAHTGETYGWTGPAIQDWTSPRRRFAGPDWLLTGDAAGLCDPTTGEGISYALASGGLAADAILGGDAEQYDLRVRLELVPELAKAARLFPKFYRPLVLPSALRLMARSSTARRIAEQLAHGGQDYATLRPRVYESGWRMLAEFALNR